MSTGSRFTRLLRERPWAPALAITLAGAALRFWRLGALELIGDESYFWVWSRHLDWAYYDHPAGVALTIWLSTALGGASEAGIRWLNALLGVACIVLTYALGVQMLSRRAGLFAALLVALGAPYVLTSRFVYTDALQLALLLLNLICFWRLVEEKPAPHLGTALAFGASLALLFNTKFSAYLVAAALLVAVLLDHRWLLAQRRAWLAASIGALGLVPAFAWNAAHDWAAFRWQLAHASLTLTGQTSLLGKAYHALTYLTWPLIAAAMAGLCRLRRPAERLLTLVALALLVPVALSPVDTPRNLASGLVPLFLLAGEWWSSSLEKRGQKWVAAGLGILGAAAAVYGAGSVMATFGPTRWPASSAVPAIRQDAAGWRELGPQVPASAPVFALDYSIASQIWYYSGRPAYTGWGQYRIWGIPASRDWRIAGLETLPEESVNSRLQAAFEAVSGPRLLRAEEWGTTKTVRIWEGRLLHQDMAAFVRELDFLTLLQASR